MKPLLNLLLGKKPNRKPVWLMRQAGRYLPEYRALREKSASFLDFCLNPDLAIEATLQPTRRFDLDGAILFSDILVIPYAMGQEVAFKEGEGPVLGPLGDWRGLSFDQDKLRPVYDALYGLAAQLPASLSLIGFAGAPWTLLSYMLGEGRDIDKAKTLARSRPEDFTWLLEQVSDAVATHLIAQAKAGAQLVQIFDSWAGALAYDDLLRWSKEPLRRIIAKVKAACPTLPIILFPRGIGSAYRAYVEIGADALSLDQAVPLDWAARTLHPSIILQGNLDPLLLVKGGLAMKEEMALLHRALPDRHIVNLGHGILPQTPPNHVEEFIRLAHRDIA